MQERRWCSTAPAPICTPTTSPSSPKRSEPTSYRPSIAFSAHRSWRIYFPRNGYSPPCAKPLFDHNHIVTALRPFYEGSWISTGHGKGGATAVHHRRFFPDDVDATVAYVTPISFAAPDEGYIPFLDQIGEDDDCREALRQLQRRALERFDSLLMRAQLEAIERGWFYDRVGGHSLALQRSLGEDVVARLGPTTPVDLDAWGGRCVSPLAHVAHAPMAGRRPPPPWRISSHVERRSADDHHLAADRRCGRHPAPRRYRN
jgi:hypothetical protein